MFNLCQISQHVFNTPLWIVRFFLALRYSQLHSHLCAQRSDRLIIFQTECWSTHLPHSLTVSCPCCHTWFPTAGDAALIMLLSFLIVFGHLLCPAALSLFLSIIQRDEQHVFSTTKQHQYEDQLSFTLCSEQIHCDEKRKREKYLSMHWKGAKIIDGPVYHMSYI